jgi:transposase
MGSDRAASRRRYNAELKSQVMAECDAAGASVAKVAMTHGINANVVHRWRQLVREGQATTPLSMRQFVPVALASTLAPISTGEIQIQLRRGATALSITWPVAAASDCAAWVRELLR